MPDTLTFLFTDVEGSTRRWERDPDEMRDAMAVHDRVLAAAVEAHGGAIFKDVGDGICAVFGDPVSAIGAATEAQRSLRSYDWGTVPALRARMGVHTAPDREVHRLGEDFRGPPVNRCARLAAAAHGGQIVASTATALAAGGAVDLRDLGEHRLRDLSAAERIYQICHPDLPTEFPPLRTLDHFPNNLPSQLTSFIGRDEEVHHLATVLDRSRLVSLTGAGGTGKTRLAVAVAAEVLPRFADGAWLVELATTRDPELVGHEIAVVLGVRESPGRRPLEQVREHLASRRALLVLDNCEHLVDACAAAADALLRACPELRILATSREALGVPGEVVTQVDPLDPGSAAVQLFRDRARAVTPDVDLDAHGDAVARICRRLDGIPLAIELAAARLPVLGPEELDARLDDRFRVLTSGSRVALPRHQTLRAAMDWSYELLDEEERQLLRRLSVFDGTVEFADVEAVVIGDDTTRDPLDLIGQLVAKSLLTTHRDAGRTRFGMLQTVRSYAREQLRDAADAEATLARHTRWVLEAVRSAPDDDRGTERLHAVIDDARAALDRLTDSDPSRAAELATALVAYWWSNGFLTEGRRRLRAVLAALREPSPAIAAKLHCWLAVLAVSQGDFAAAEKEGASVTDAGGDYATTVYALWAMGVAAWAQGQTALATERHERGCSVARRIGERWGEIIHLHALGRIALSVGDADRAEQLLQDGAALTRPEDARRGGGNVVDLLAQVALARGDAATAAELASDALTVHRQAEYQEGIASASATLGEAELRRGRIDDARRHLVHAVDVCWRIGQDAGMIRALEGLAGVAIAEEDDERAARLLGAADALRTRLHVRRGPAEEEIHGRRTAQLRARMGDGPFSTAVGAGRDAATADAVRAIVGAPGRTPAEAASIG